MPLGSSRVLADEHEWKRLAALRSYNLDGPAPEAAFDHIVRLAADLVIDADGRFTRRLCVL